MPLGSAGPSGLLLEEDGVVDQPIPPSPRLTLGAAAIPSGSSAGPTHDNPMDGGSAVLSSSDG